MSNLNAIQALKKAHQARAITRDTYSLKDYHTNEGVKGKARMTVVAIESKYVPTQDKRHLPEGTEGAGNLGFRTRFVLENGETVGTFSNAAHRFAEFFAVDVMGNEPEQNFIRIDVQGTIVVEISQQALDGNRTTWDFQLIEEGSDVKGFGNYVPDLTGVLQLQSGDYANTETGEITDTPDVNLDKTAEAADPATDTDKPNPKKK